MPAKTSMLSVKIEKLILQMQAAGKVRTAQVYRTALNNFLRFREGEDLPLRELSAQMILSYEAWMHSRGLMRNSSSFYLRSLRSAWRKAMGSRSVHPDPFADVYTGVDKTVKRTVSLYEIRRLKAMTLEGDEAWARDLFLFSFYTRGMSFVDMAFLRKADLRGSLLTYCRRKTGQQLLIRWEPCMQEILDRWGPNPTQYLLPIITRTDLPAYNQYKCASARVNRCLHLTGRKLGLKAPLTMYVARHSWASIAHSRHIPLSVISEGLGHDSERTTSIYLASLDQKQIDSANRTILRLL
ncbi:MAG: site-specific integrase [Bacteroidales bacterium]|nr:site-specific integrase [Bacteroidales bacterium]